MLEGLWSIELGIRETDMQGAGVVVFENQRVLGGSSDYFYTGRYEVKEGFVQGEVEVKFYGRNPSPIFRGIKIKSNWLEDRAGNCSETYLRRG